MTASKATAFVAYASHDPAIGQMIIDATRKANSVPQPYRLEGWECNDIPGTPLISPILAQIEGSPFVVADITYLNLNVIYEVGFAIGKGKRAFLIRHKHTEGNKAAAKEAGIFDTLGYYDYEDADQLRDRLSSHIDTSPLPFTLALDRKAPVYLVEPGQRTTAATVMVSLLKKAGYRYRSFNPGEDTRLAASDAIRQVACSAGVLVLLQGKGCRREGGWNWLTRSPAS